MEMDLKTKIEVLACSKCEDMIDCESCYLQKEAQELYNQIRTEVIEKVKIYIRLKTKYAEHSKDDYVFAHEMYDWLDKQLKENK